MQKLYLIHSLDTYLFCASIIKQANHSNTRTWKYYQFMQVDRHTIAEGRPLAVFLQYLQNTTNK